MLGNPGSNQLELFWDVVDGLDQTLDAKIAIVQEGIQRYNRAQREDAGGDTNMDAPDTKDFAVDTKTTEEQFRSVLKNCTTPAVTAMSEDDLHLVFCAVNMCLSNVYRPIYLPDDSSTTLQ